MTNIWTDHNSEVADVSVFYTEEPWLPNEIKVKRLTETAILPTRSNLTDAGLDIYADQDAVLYYGDVVKIKTGIALAVPVGFYGDLRSRSSYWSRGLLVHGTIDSDYRGELIVVMGWTCMDRKTLDAGIVTQYVRRGDKIAQLVLTQIITPNAVEVDELSETQRGSSGFGSTGG